MKWRLSLRACRGIYCDCPRSGGNILKAVGKVADIICLLSEVEIMSVEIFGTEENFKNFRCIPVSSEELFNTVWQRAIDALGLRLIGNGVWLFKKDLRDILDEFKRVDEYIAQNESIPMQCRLSISERIGAVLRDLESNWNEVSDVERLWMG